MYEGAICIESVFKFTKNLAFDVKYFTVLKTI